MFFVREAAVFVPVTRRRRSELQGIMLFPRRVLKVPRLPLIHERANCLLWGLRRPPPLYLLSLRGGLFSANVGIRWPRPERHPQGHLRANEVALYSLVTEPQGTIAQRSHQEIKRCKSFPLFEVRPHRVEI